MTIAGTRAAGKGVDAEEGGDPRGEFVPPMFTFRDPDGNRFRVVERDGGPAVRRWYGQG